MMEADIIHMPAPDLVFEFSVEPSARRFVRVQEKEKGYFIADVITYLPGKAVLVSEKPYEVIVSNNDMEVRGGAANSDKFAALFAVSIGLLMLNIQGIEKIPIDTTIFNRSRIRRGRAIAPAHSLIHIGSVYDRKMQQHKRGTETGSKMPVHFRTAHTRRQHHGPDNSLVKIIFVPGILVNFSADEDFIPVKKKVVI
jgi:hypothetical protein